MARRSIRVVWAFNAGVAAGFVTYALLPVRRTPDCSDLYDCDVSSVELGGYLRSALGTLDLSNGAELMPGIWLPIVLGIVIAGAVWAILGNHDER